MRRVARGTRRRIARAGLVLITATACAGWGLAACDSLDDLTSKPSPAETGPDTPLAETGPSCPDGKRDCDGDPTNGCETDVSANTSHCGFCGNVCAPVANGYPVCDKGTCKVACNTGFDNCDANPTNGCERDVSADPTNCGACNHDCLGAACSKSLCAPVQIASGQVGVQALAVDANDLVFATSNVDAGVGFYEIKVRRLLKKQAGSLLTVANYSEGEAPVTRLFSSPPYVVWGGVISALFVCIAPNCQQPGPTGGPLLYTYGTAFDVRDNTLYHAEGIALDKMNLYSIGLADSGAFDASSASVLAEVPFNPQRMALSNDLIYISGIAYNPQVHAAIKTLPRNAPDAAPTTILATVNGSEVRTELAPTDDGVFYGNVGALNFCSKTGCGDAATEMGRAATTISQIVVDDKYVYFATIGTSANQFLDANIHRCPRAGCVGAPFSLATNVPRVRALAVDATHIYWGGDDGRIQKVAK